jgi:hypothetical protein
MHLCQADRVTEVPHYQPDQGVLVPMSVAYQLKVSCALVARLGPVLLELLSQLPL